MVVPSVLGQVVAISYPVRRLNTVHSQGSRSISLQSALVSSLLIVVFGLGGCGMNGPYREEHQISNLNVVFVDEHSLHQEWKAKTGRSGVEFVAFKSGDFPAVKSLRGFYDFTTNTLYCPKWNFEVCGHELHHAVLGHFHEPH